MNPFRSIALLCLATFSLSAQEFPDYYYNPYQDRKFEKVDFSKPLPFLYDSPFELTIVRPAPPSLSNVSIYAGQIKIPCSSGFQGGPSVSACLDTPRFLSVNRRGIALVIQDNGEARMLDGANAWGWWVPKGTSGPVALFDNTDLVQGGFNTLMRTDRFVGYIWPNPLTASPTSMALDGWDRLWIADGSSIQWTDGATGGRLNVALPAGTRDPYAQVVMKPTRVASDPTIDRLVFATKDALFELDPNSGKVTHLSGIPGNSGSADGPKGTATFGEIVGLAVHRSGWVLVADAGVGQLRLVDPQGNVTTINHYNGYLGQQGLADLGEVAFDGDTALVLAPKLHVVWKIN